MTRGALKMALVAFLQSWAECAGSTFRCFLHKTAEHFGHMKLTKTETAFVLLAIGLLAAGLAVDSESTAVYDALTGAGNAQAFVFPDCAAKLVSMGAWEMVPALC